tara:strand:+ start:2304 stop:4754 length:2451 start_codon:yes stop_codon:yes gene_type:complete
VAAPPTPHTSLIYFFFNYYKMFRGTSSYEPLFNRGGSSGSSAVLLLFGGGMMFLLLIAVLLFILIMYRKKDRRKSRSERQSELRRRLQNRTDNIYKGAADVGIDKEDVDDILIDKKTEIDTLCLTYPKDGYCNPVFYELRDGCCKLRSTASQEAKNARTQVFKDMFIEVSILLITEFIVLTVLPRLGRTLAGATSKALATAVARTARMTASKVALIGTNYAARFLIKLGAGPVGWALLVFEIISFTLDAADLKNYNAFIENKGLLESRDILIHKFQEAVVSSGGDYPMLFPFSSIFPDESTVATEDMMSYMLIEYIDELMEVDGGLDYLTNAFMSAFSEEEEDTETVEEEEEGNEVINEWFKVVRTKHGKELDKYVFDALQAEIPASKRNDIFLVPSMSSVNTIGISISEKASERWNKENRAEWFQYIDPFYPVPMPEEDWIPPYAAVFTNEYMKLRESNPGVDNRPNLVKATLPNKVTLCFPFAPLVASCEKERTSAKHKDPLNPQDFGVKFNYKTGVCEFTRDYCERVGLDYKTKTWKDNTPYSDCELTKGQDWAEKFLGVNVVRNAKRWADDPDNIGEDLGQLYKDRKEEHGEAGAVALTIVDPLGLSEAGRGMAAGYKEQLRGKDKFCQTGDTCKFFTAKHNGGNLMTWSARDSDGYIYPHPTLYQGQVKDGEDHTFYVPVGGYFRVKCEPGEGKDFSYDEIPDNGRKDYTCWNGKVNKPYNVGDTFVAAGDLLEDAAKKAEEDTSVNVSDKGVAVTIPGGSAEVGDKGASVAYGGGEVSADNKGVKIKTPFGDIKIAKQDDPFGDDICTIM